MIEQQEQTETVNKILDILYEHKEKEVKNWIIRKMKGEKCQK